MEGQTDFKPQVEFKINSPEVLFGYLAKNTHGVLTKINDPKINSSFPYIIDYPQKQIISSEDTIRVYRGIRSMPLVDFSQLPSILKTEKLSEKLIQLTYKLADDASPKNYRKIRKEYKHLGNDVSYLDYAESYIKRYMNETGGTYSDGFYCMHDEKNYASPYVASSGNLKSALFYAGYRGNTTGVVIVADVPKDHVIYDSCSSFDEEILVKGILKQEYVRSAILFQPQKNLEYQQSANLILPFLSP